ncbi:uncharacterized protein SCHCODRAFT_02704432 [Schizophyllum commune H4-8]|nr:uncharacterized protein SCHCODRAFT_02704432 [Schizophyllum commune H4-8]KAI5888467.1 hypothetical protein SCHCODRAFT_02704432 [Schizophyllum commune H4-8]
MSFTATAAYQYSASSTATSSSYGHTYPATLYAHALPSDCTYYNPAKPKGDLSPIPAQTQIDYKVQLRARLATGALRDTPEGFPFKVENHAIVCKSFEHYETLPDGALAAIRFDPPEPHCKYFSWRAYVPTHCHADQRRTTAKYASGEVQLHPNVLNTRYGKQATKSPIIILRALAVSLEIGMLLTIRVADARTMSLPRNVSASPIRQGDVVFVGTDNAGRREVVFNASAGDV